MDRTEGRAPCDEDQVSLFKPVLELNLLCCCSLTPSAPQKEVISGIESTILGPDWTRLQGKDDFDWKTA